MILIIQQSYYEQDEDEGPQDEVVTALVAVVRDREAALALLPTLLSDYSVSYGPRECHSVAYDPKAHPLHLLSGEKYGEGGIFMHFPVGVNPLTQEAVAIQFGEDIVPDTGLEWTDLYLLEYQADA